MTTQTQSQVIHSDVMDPARAAALNAALGNASQVVSGQALPPFYHQIYFWDAKTPSDLGRDGHPKVGGVIPDLGLPRRMWAGGRLAFHTDLVAGQVAEKRTIVETQTQKTGRSGPLGFVTLRHEIWQNAVLCATEWQDLVYREDADANAPKPIAPEARRDETDCRAVSFDPTMLFRYSALTFNGHRIHYDIEYARTVEGYGGLVVHGPLLAQLLMLMAHDLAGSLHRFSFRATSPLMHFETAELCRAGGDMWVRGPDGRQCMQAQFEA